MFKFFILLIPTLALSQTRPIQDAIVANAMVSASLTKAQVERDALQAIITAQASQIAAQTATIAVLQSAASQSTDTDLNAVCANCKKDISAIVASAKAEGRTFDLAIFLKWDNSVFPKPMVPAVKQ